MSYGIPNRPEDQKRLARVLRILVLLQTEPQAWSRARLCAHFDVSSRAIDNDLELLRAVGVDIKRRGMGYEVIEGRSQQVRSE